mgnify:FL=1
MATSRTDDVSRIVDRFEAFRPARLVFTRLDETAVPGVMAAEALRRNRALSFLGVGAGVPEDLRPAVKERIVRMLVGALPETVSERS